MKTPVNRVLRGSAIALAVIATLALVAAAALYLAVRGSLPKLDGDEKLRALSAPVSATRDGVGMVTITATQLADANRALGYLHAQERFFEMDLTRRSAAGELSALLGAATVRVDREKRQHRLRARMALHWQVLPADEQMLLRQYAEGVNAGLEALRMRPWQYLILRASPEPWTPLDSMLVVCEMYAMLQGRDAENRFNDALLRSQIGDALFDWLKPKGGSWDAPLDGSVIAPTPTPTVAQLNLRIARSAVGNARAEMPIGDPELKAGSNNWALGGALTAHGGGMLANDMHLGHSVPNIWFRTQLMIGDTAQNMRRIVGVSLPGLPGLAVGSNGDIAWGFTNATGKWFDWVPLAADEKIAEVSETILVKGAEAVSLTVRETRFGPVLRAASVGGRAQSFALSWSLYRPGAVNTSLGQLMFAGSVDEALALARRAGMPHQNIVIVDRAGNLAWTIAGRIQHYPDWAHHGDRGRFTAPEQLADGWLDTEQYPLIKNPASSRIATANNRLLGGVEASKIGDGGFDPGARAGQIRDRLTEQQRFTESDLFAIQRDTQSRFLARWAELASKVASQSNQPAQRSVVLLLGRWNGKADIDQPGHRIARAYRQALIDSLWKAWLKAAGAAPLPESASGKQSTYPGWDGRAEYAVWSAITEQPLHLLPLPYESWQAFLAAQLTAVLEDLTQQHGELARATWGERNRANIAHPFSRAIPALGPWLDMPRDALPGDNNMPMVAAPAFGASERMVVAPGFEETAIFNMPGGQSGHPLSPFYGAGHQDWVVGNKTPLLAGKAIHTLVFKP